MTGGRHMARHVLLRPFEELRLSVGRNSQHSGTEPVSIKLLTVHGGSRGRDYKPPGQGTAEIFGRELVPQTEESFGSGLRFAVYSWGGCSLQVKGDFQEEQVAPAPCMHSFLRIATAMGARREVAAENETFGPRVLVTGAAGAGKSTLCQLLLNYGIRQGWRPIFVELDPRGSYDCPGLSYVAGSIGAHAVTEINPSSIQDPVVFGFGHLERSSDPILFGHICKCISAAISARLGYSLTQHHTDSSELKDDTDGSDYKSLAASGIIINAPSQPKAEELYELVEIFGVDLILVLDSLPMRHILGYRYGEDDGKKAKKKDPAVQVVLLPKFEGAVQHDADSISYTRQRSFDNYFLPLIQNGNLVKTKLRVDEIEFMTFDKSKYQGNNVMAIPWSGSVHSLLHVVIGIPATTDKVALAFSNLLGFCYVTAVMGELPGDEVLEFFSPIPFKDREEIHLLLVPSDLDNIRWNGTPFDPPRKNESSAKALHTCTNV